MRAVSVLATRWAGGWELELDENHHTQVATLVKARQQVVDYLDTVEEDVDHSDWDIQIIPEIEAYAQVKAARRAMDEAARAQKKADELVRRTVLQLRAEGISFSDIATLMEISRGRVSRLAKNSSEKI